MNNEQPKILYSHSEDDWSHASEDLDESIDYMIDELGISVSDADDYEMFSGEACQLRFSDLIRIDDIIDLAGDGECEYVEHNDELTDYENKITTEQREELGLLIQTWADKHELNPKRLIVKNIKAINVCVSEDRIRLVTGLEDD